MIMHCTCPKPVNPLIINPSFAGKSSWPTRPPIRRLQLPRSLDELAPEVGPPQADSIVELFLGDAQLLNQYAGQE